MHKRFVRSNLIVLYRGGRRAYQLGTVAFIANIRVKQPRAFSTSITMRTSVGIFLACVLVLIIAACTPQATLAPESTASPTEEPTATPATSVAADEIAILTPAPFDSPLAAKMDAWLSRQAETNAFKGAVLVAQGDEVILNKGYGMADEENEIPNTPQTKFRIGDLTKPFTAMAIMRLAERNLLNVQDPICDYLDNCAAAWSSVTIHQLLTNSSGIPDYLSQPANQEKKSTPLPLDQLLAPVKELPLEFDPGNGWAWSSTGSLLLGQIIERVSGQPYALFMQENFFGPLQMVDTGLDDSLEELALGYKYSTELADPVAMQNLYATGDMYSSVEDLHRWIEALDSNQLVSPATRELILTGYVEIDPGRSLSNGYGWIIDMSEDHPNFGQPGYLDGFSAVMLHYVADDLTIIVLTNQDNADAPDIGFSLKDMAFSESKLDTGLPALVTSNRPNS